MKKLYRKFVVASVSAAVVSSMVVPSGMAAQVHFSDVEKGAFYYDAVQNLAARGIIHGFKDGSFRPNEHVTRGQAAVMFASALGLKTIDTKNPVFKDVPTNSWYYHSIAALVDAGIISGFSDKTFRPNDTLTRAQAAAMISLAFHLNENKQAAIPFKDISHSDWYAGFVGALLENGVTKGITETQFGPDHVVTRGQLATFIFRSEEKISTKSVIENVTNSTVVINGKTYQLSEQVKPILNEGNKAVLHNALITFESSNSTITKIHDLEIMTSGQNNEHVILDGNNGVIAGDVKISADYVTVQNLTVEGNFEIGHELQNSFYSNHLVVLGKTLVSEQQEKSDSIIAAAEQKKIKIIFENSKLRIVEVNKNNASIESKGETTLVELTVASNASIEASDGAVIPKITLQIGAEAVEINASVTELTVESIEAIILSGEANIDSVTVNTSAPVNLNTTGEIKKIEATSKDVQLTVGENAKVKDITLPEGSKVEDIVKNYDDVKENIEKVGGEKNPDADKPSKNTGGGTTVDRTAPTAVTNVAGTSIDTELEAVGGVHNTITWDKNLANDFNHYEVYRLDSSGAAATKVGSNLKTETFIDENVTPDATYSYTVYAFDRNGNKSIVSNTATVTTANDEFPATNPQLQDVIVNGVTFTPEMFENIFITPGELNAIHSFKVRATEVAADIDVTVTTTLENGTVVHEILAKQQNTSEVELDIASMKEKHGMLPAGVYHFTIKFTNNKGEVESVEVALNAMKDEREYIAVNGAGHPNGEQDQLFNSVRPGLLEINMPEITAENGFKVNNGVLLGLNTGDLQYKDDFVYASATIPKTEIPSDYTIKYYTVNDTKYDGAPNDYGTANYFFVSKIAEFINDNDPENVTLNDWVRVPEYTKDIKIYTENAKGEEKVFTLTVNYHHNIEPIDLSGTATMENFNTHAEMDYLGVNVGWNFSDLDFSKVKELRVNLYDSEGIIATNVGNLEKLKELYSQGTRTFSTPFFVAELAYQKSEDEYWNFGEVDWSTVSELKRAELVLVGLDDTEYKFENTNFVQPEETLKEVLTYYPIGLVLGADSVGAMRAALENEALELNRELYNGLTEEGKQSVSKIMYFLMDAAKNANEEEIGFLIEFIGVQYLFDIGVNFEYNKLSLVNLLTDNEATSEDLSTILYRFVEDQVIEEEEWTQEIPAFLNLVLSDDEEFDIIPYLNKHFGEGYKAELEKLREYIEIYDELTDTAANVVFDKFKDHEASDSFDTIIGYVFDAIDEVTGEVEEINFATTVSEMQAALENPAFNLDRTAYYFLTEGGRRNAVADFVLFDLEEYGDFTSIDQVQEVFDVGVQAETHKIELIQLVTKEGADVAELSNILGSLVEDCESMLEHYGEEGIDRHYGDGFVESMDDFIDLVDSYNSLSVNEKQFVFERFQENEYNGSFVTTVGNLAAAMDYVLENEPLYIERAYTHDLNGDGILDSYLIQTNRAINDSSILEGYFTVDGVQIDSIDSGGTNNDEYFWINFGNSDLGTDQLPQLSVMAGAFKDSNENFSIELKAEQDVEEDSAEPFITSVTTSNTTDSSVDVQILTQEGGTAYYVVLPAEAAAPDLDQVLEGTESNSTETINFTGLTASTEYKVYVVVEDAMGNVSDVAVADFKTNDQLEELTVPNESIALPDSPTPEESSTPPDATTGDELNEDPILGNEEIEESETQIDLIIVEDTDENEEPMPYSATLTEDKQTITINLNK